MRKMLVYIADKMADFEISLTCNLLGKYGWEIIPVAYENAIITASSGLQYVPRFTISEISQDSDIDGIIIPGGFHFEQREELTNLIQAYYHTGKLTAAICAGPQYLARAGLLENTHYTTTMTKESHKELFSGSGEFPFPEKTYIEKPVVRDGTVITAKGVAFIDFSIEILDYFKAFTDESEKREIALRYQPSTY
ncbi:DJ-1/PfpI family protein [Methanospirillum lacunae]|uniref:Thiamine biosynthesis protein ThiJ n=1 Tax=Methanospirillum lacunae TaxID=668570 RepID=A0A2V2MXZ1_9EURY|nr:DJ-1/PfpI family protein [Methanospirillum lacunae]PWR70256.1 thiamine biosynthesis protein ThiJ [Methanospirillum lacunae]